MYVILCHRRHSTPDPLLDRTEHIDVFVGGGEIWGVGLFLFTSSGSSFTKTPDSERLSFFTQFFSADGYVSIRCL